MRHQIMCGNCLDVLKELDDDSIDLMVTDPPYGLSFMGMNWDKALPNIKIWKECLRVLKPGAFAFVMCIPRQDCLSRMIINLEDAGFKVDFTSVYHVFASGFPKATNISKRIDKTYGRIGVSIVDIKNKLICLFDESGKTRSTIDKECGFRACNYLTLPVDGKQPDPWVNILPSPTKWKKIKEVLGCTEDISGELDKFFAEAERVVVGKVTKARAEGQKFALPTIGAKVEYIDLDITIPASPEANSFNGSYAGFNPKPAIEVIIVAMKPLSEKSYTDQAVKNKKGITWLDDVRTPFSSKSDMKSSETGYTHTGHQAYGESDIYGDAFKRPCQDDDEIVHPSSRGRFPANLLVSDDILNDGKIRKNTYILPKYKNQRKGEFLGSMGHPGFQGYNDSGSFSRYFDLDIWWQERVKKLPKEVQKTFPFLIVPKASKSEKDKGLEQLSTKDIPYSGYRENYDTTKSYVSEYPDGKPRPMNKVKNNHPTIKPLTLMSYLITLGSRKNDVVLDPFVGSGTVSLASNMLSRKSIGIEINPEYVKIAKARLKSVSSLDEWL